MTPEAALSELANDWNSRIRCAKDARQPWAKLASQCRYFLGDDSGFMWQPSFQEMMGSVGLSPPQFDVTNHKAHEYVAIIGPYLFWQNPRRRVRPQSLPDYPEEFNSLLGPEASLAVDEIQRNRDVAATTAESYLNATPNRQRSTLQSESKLCTLDALITGIGVLWSEAYRTPGSTRTLTGSFRQRPDTVLVDPDCFDPHWQSATWICRAHIEPAYRVARKFPIDPAKLRDAALLQKNAQTRESQQFASRHDYSEVGDCRRPTKTRVNDDLVVWYEVFSRRGIGSTSKSFPNAVEQKLDAVAGDFVRLCFAPGIHHPLNLPPESLAGTSDQVRANLAWNHPCWKENRWPCSTLRFYDDPDGAYPIPPLAPAMGELITMNMLSSLIVQDSYQNRQLIVAVLKQHAKDVEKEMRTGKSPVFLQLNEANNKKITDIIQFLDRPSMNSDIMQALDMTMSQFDKRLGLSDFLYASNAGGVSRSAADIEAKRDVSQIRPDKMSQDVATWQVEAASLEIILAADKVMGEDVQSFLGPHGAAAWEMFVRNVDSIDLAHDLNVEISASELRKPNHDRDASNMQAMTATVLPILEGARQQTGRAAQVNAFIRELGRSMQQEVEDWLLDDVPTAGGMPFGEADEGVGEVPPETTMPPNSLALPGDIETEEFDPLLAGTNQQQPPMAQPDLAQVLAGI